MNTVVTLLQADMNTNESQQAVEIKTEPTQFINNTSESLNCEERSVLTPTTSELTDTLNLTLKTEKMKQSETIDTTEQMVNDHPVQQFKVPTRSGQTHILPEPIIQQPKKQ